MGLEMVKTLPGIKALKPKLQSQERELLEELLDTSPFLVKIIRRLDSICGATEHLSKKPLHFSLAIMKGLELAVANKRNGYLLPKYFYDGICNGLVLSMDFNIATNDELKLWDYFIETSEDFYLRHKKRVKVIESPLTLSDEARSKLRNTMAGKVLNRTELQAWGVPGLGRTEMLSKTRRW